MPSKRLRLSSMNGCACSFTKPFFYFFLYHEHNIKSDKKVFAREEKKSELKKTRQWTHPLAIIGCEEKMLSRKIRFRHVPNDFFFFHPRTGKKGSECSLPCWWTSLCISERWQIVVDFPRFITCRWLGCVTWNKIKNKKKTNIVLHCSCAIVLHFISLSTSSRLAIIVVLKKKEEKKGILYSQQKQREKKTFAQLIRESADLMVVCWIQYHRTHIQLTITFSLRNISRSKKKKVFLFLCLFVLSTKQAFISCSVFDVNALKEI